MIEEVLINDCESNIPSDKALSVTLIGDVLSLEIVALSEKAVEGKREKRTSKVQAEVGVYVLDLTRALQMLAGAQNDHDERKAKA